LDDLVLPILVRLSDVSQWLKKHPSNDTLEDALVNLIGAKRSETFRRLVREKLETDRCVVLLDAWDEVPVEVPQNGQPIAFEPGLRQHLGQRLEAFARDFPQPRLLLTSRIVGYTASPIPDAQELELLAFERPQIEAFAHVWFGDDAETAEQFLAMLRQNHQVRGLARIPLMLSLMCRAYQEGQLDFPTRRGDLYDRCLRGLLRDWKEEKEQPRISDIRLERALWRLAEGAFQLHVDRREQFTEPQLAKALGFNLERDTEAEQAEKFVDSLKHDGILITAGGHRDAPLLFLHRTFHEYLAACALARRANSEGWSAIAPLVDKKAWLPVWQEVIILLAGKLEDPVPLLELLADEEKDDYFRHRLALAALCLPELKSEIRNSQSEVVDDITTAVISLWWEHRLNVDTVAAIPHLTRALPALGQINARLKATPFVEWFYRQVRHWDWSVWRVRETTPLIEWFCHQLQKTGWDWKWWKVVAVEALRAIGAPAAQHRQVLPALVEVALRDHWVVRHAAAQALEVTGVGTARYPHVLSALVEALRNADRDTRWAAIEVLRVIGAAAAEHPQVLPALVEVALQDEDGEVRLAAKEVLEAMGAVVAQHPQVLPDLVKVALRDADWNMRRAAIELLKVIGGAAAQHPHVLPALVEALHDEDEIVRWAAEEVVGAIGAAAARDPQVLSALVQTGLWGPDVPEQAYQVVATAAALHFVSNSEELAQQVRDELARRAAAQTLKAIGVTAAQDPQVVSALVDALRSVVRDVRRAAVQALGSIGAAAARYPYVLPALVRAVLQDTDDDVRRLAVEALGLIGAAVAQDPQMFPALGVVDLLDEQWDMYGATMEMLDSVRKVAALSCP
jgi:HEAT repeat protein